MKIGDKFLITCDNWFIAPDGEQYRAVFGTVHGVQDSEATLGIKTNAKSTNWYVMIGNMVLAGCQIHYAVRCDDYSDNPPTVECEHDGQYKTSKGAMTRIYNADAA